MNRLQIRRTVRHACAAAQTRPSLLIPVECAEMTDRAVAVALDVAAPVDERRLATHVAACTRCAATLAEFREAAARLGAAVPQIDPLAHLIGQLLAAAEAKRGGSRR